MKKGQLKEKSESVLENGKPPAGLVLLIMCGFALPVAVGIVIYKVIKKMKSSSGHNIHKAADSKQAD